MFAREHVDTNTSQPTQQICCIEKERRKPKKRGGIPFCMLAQLVQASTGVLIFQHTGDHPLRWAALGTPAFSGER